MRHEWPCKTIDQSSVQSVTSAIGLAKPERRRAAACLGIFTLLTILFALPIVSHAFEQTPYASPVDAAQSLPHSTQVITIGVALPFEVGSLAWTQLNSVQLAIDQTNATGGIDLGTVNYQLALAVENSPCDGTNAAAAAANLLGAGVVAVVGHACTGASLLALPVYESAGVPMVCASCTAPSLTQQGSASAFRTITHDGTPPTLLATHLHNYASLSRCAVVESAWGQPGDYFATTFASLGGVVTGRHIVTATHQLTATLTTVQGQSPDCIANFMMDPDAAVHGQLSRIAYELGMTDVVIGWSLWGSNPSPLAQYVAAAGAPAAENDYVAMQFRQTQDMPGWPTFLAAYQSAGFVNEPDNPEPFGPFAYDAVQMIIAAIVRANSVNPTAIRDELAATERFSGVVGTYQGFDPQGDVIPQWAWLERFHNLNWITLNPPMWSRVEPAGGGLTSYDERTEVTIPGGAIANPVILTHTPAYAMRASGNLASIGQAFDLRATYVNTGQPAQPARPYQLTIGYADGALGAAQETTLALYRWTGSQWVKEPSSMLNITNNVITASPNSFALFAVLGETNSVRLPIALRNR